MMEQLKTLSMADLCDFFKCSRAVINRWRNPKSPYYKPNFPIALTTTHKPIFLQSDLLRFIAEEQAKEKAKKEEQAKNRAEINKHQQRLQAKKEQVLQLKRSQENYGGYIPEKQEISKHILRKIQRFDLGLGG